MIIISNNLTGKLPLPAKAIIRVNLAWIKSIKEARQILNESQHDIYLDYPQGRTKPPKPTIKLDEAIRLTNHPKVKYFAVSNVEDIESFESLRDSLGDVEFIPKIETPLGVENIGEMIKAGIKTIMIDKEDLYTSVQCDSQEFNDILQIIRTYKNKIKILELQGVVFI